MHWRLSHRADQEAIPLADRHYNRQKPGTPQFVPPGRCIVLLAEDALWVTSWPYPEYVKHAWPGAWVNSLFRNEGSVLSSLLIRDAIAATRYYWEPPELGIVTFVDASKVRSMHPGYCYLKAGFLRAGKTAGGLIALQMKPEEMPEPAPPANAQLLLPLEDIYG
jgi:hypothetical protein